jgi:hypothetical protein
VNDGRRSDFRANKGRFPIDKFLTVVLGLFRLAFHLFLLAVDLLVGLAVVVVD